ncbi:MAG: metallophosphoesterase [Xanthomonadaceae bacterium]|jgi:hypothetical protein|nr:metallophosphoesterase [Xanthomonadaceae bacterium]
MNPRTKISKVNNVLLTLACLFIFIPAAITASAAPNCSALNGSPVFHLVNPTTKANLLTTNQTEAQNAKASFGFTDDRGTIFYASKEWISGLTPAYRLYHPKSHNFFWTINQNEIDTAVNSLGYEKGGVNFFVSSTPAECTQPVYRYRQGAIHRYAVKQADRDKLLADGWVYDGLHFYAGVGNQDNNTVFSIAIVPDTQQEVQAATPRNLNDLRFRQRMQWLVDNKNSLDLRYVLHSGDAVNWGERDTHQYNVATDAYQVLRAAGIPFNISIGNHDTRAVCAGGSACPGENAHTTLRQLPLFNSYFEPLMGPHVAGRYQPGELANTYSRFEAGGVKWLVLSIELWPRAPVVEWAKGVVAAHPTHNVIIVTHSFLTGNNAINTSNGGYGDQSPQYLYENLVRLYPNIRFVFSGHEGNASSRTFTGNNGNKIVASLQSFHSGSTNPVRIMEIDTAKNTVKTYIVAPKTNEYWTQYNYSETGMNFVR